MVNFCPDCNNMLYPKENRQEKRLLYACRNCNHYEIAESNCIYKHQVMHHAGDQMQQLISDVAKDPTLPRTRDVQCPRCEQKEVVYFQTRARRADATMTLYYVCCNQECGHKWADTSAQA
ncbi:hypothetical protein MIR68_010673 [Amoeboaphelidium protococcarum]|nr:hypothetical protein MIR68_010673 [Amoeboaphelidium protococcarum]KAI3647573.1 hypothetical protein MP228_007794 [Amoeboaphelidium protococcarum]KAI3647576.1 hypothetical protein MP228_007797 [Amoeboaphelidium protococcarum]